MSAVASARAALWAWTEARRLGAALPGGGIASLDAVRPPPPASDRHRAAVVRALGLAGATCLVRAAVLQRWDAEHDRARALVVGVARDADGAIAAHAWLEGDADGDGFIALHRRPVTGAGR